jgi:hypothetical protein
MDDFIMYFSNHLKSSQVVFTVKNICKGLSLTQSSTFKVHFGWPVGGPWMVRQPVGGPTAHRALSDFPVLHARVRSNTSRYVDGSILHRT